MTVNNLKRTIVFIDAGNFLSGFRNYCYNHNYTKINPDTGKKEITKKINYAKLILALTTNTDYIRGYFYDATPYPIETKKQSFFDMLRKNQITVVTKPLRYKSSICKHCKTTDSNIPYQKGVDVSLVTDVMSLAIEKAFDIAIIISGDNDFVDALNFIKSKGLKIEVASFHKSLGADIMRAADKIIYLDDLFNQIIL